MTYVSQMNMNECAKYDKGENMPKNNYTKFIK